MLRNDDNSTDMGDLTWRCSVNVVWVEGVTTCLTHPLTRWPMGGFYKRRVQPDAPSVKISAETMKMLLALFMGVFVLGASATERNKRGLLGSWVNPPDSVCIFCESVGSETNIIFSLKSILLSLILIAINYEVYENFTESINFRIPSFEVN